MHSVTFLISKSTASFIIGILLIACNKKTETVVAAVVNADTITETQPAVLSTAASLATASIGGYYLALPSNYQKTKKNYPVIIFFHGIGQAGNGNEELRYLLNDGPGKLLKEKKFPASFHNSKGRYSFIVVLPQYKQRPTVNESSLFISEVISKYRIDTSRIYLSGLSMGGTIIMETASRSPEKFAAVAPIAGIDFTLIDSVRCAQIAENKLPLWIFHNNDDPMVNAYYSTAFVKLINHFQPLVQPKLTLFDYYGHDAWTRALDPAFREDDLNVYEWMLRYTR